VGWACSGRRGAQLSRAQRPPHPSASPPTSPPAGRTREIAWFGEVPVACLRWCRIALGDLGRGTPQFFGPAAESVSRFQGPRRPLGDWCEVRTAMGAAPR